MAKDAPEVTNNWRLREWFPQLNNAAHLGLELYFAELKKFNEKINLVSVKTLEHADLVHFADSILASEIIKKDYSGKTMVDYGSGNGFPGMVFAILNPDIRVALVDSDMRKAEFLKHIVGVLKLKNVEVTVTRVENIPPDVIEVAMCRGFASISNSLLKTRKSFKQGGTLYHLKGDEWAKELSEIPSQVCTYWEPSLLAQYDLPLGGYSYAIVKTVRK